MTTKTDRRDCGASPTLAETLDALDGAPLYVNPSLSLDEVPESLASTLQAEGLLCALRHANAAKHEDDPPMDFSFWHIERVLAGDLPVPQHIIVDALGSETGERGEVMKNELALAYRKHLAYGSYRYLQRFPERNRHSPEAMAKVTKRFEDVLAEGYTDPELDALLASETD